MYKVFVCLFRCVFLNKTILNIFFVCFCKKKILFMEVFIIWFYKKLFGTFSSSNSLSRVNYVSKVVTFLIFSTLSIIKVGHIVEIIENRKKKKNKHIQIWELRDNFLGEIFFSETFLFFHFTPLSLLKKEKNYIAVFKEQKKSNKEIFSFLFFPFSVNEVSTYSLVT